MSEPWIVSLLAVQARLCDPLVSLHGALRSIESCLALASDCALASSRVPVQSTFEGLVLLKTPCW